MFHLQFKLPSQRLRTTIMKSGFSSKVFPSAPAPPQIRTPHLGGLVQLDQKVPQTVHYQKLLPPHWLHTMDSGYPKTHGEYQTRMVRFHAPPKSQPDSWSLPCALEGSGRQSAGCKWATMTASHPNWEFRVVPSQLTRGVEIWANRQNSPEEAIHMKWIPMNNWPNAENPQTKIPASLPLGAFRREECDVAAINWGWKQSCNCVSALLNHWNGGSECEMTTSSHIHKIGTIIIQCQSGMIETISGHHAHRELHTCFRPDDTNEFDLCCWTKAKKGCSTTKLQMKRDNEDGHPQSDYHHPNWNHILPVSTSKQWQQKEERGKNPFCKTQPLLSSSARWKGFGHVSKEKLMEATFPRDGPPDVNEFSKVQIAWISYQMAKFSVKRWTAENELIQEDTTMWRQRQ